MNHEARNIVYGTPLDLRAASPLTFDLLSGVSAFSTLTAYAERIVTRPTQDGDEWSQF